jgi:hypothetical protein
VTNAIPRVDTAAAKLGSVTKTIAALAKEYGKPDLFAPVMTALRAITAAAMVAEGTPATVSHQASAITPVPPAPAPAPAPAAAEPVDAVAELDDVLALATQAAIAAVKAALGK